MGASGRFAVFLGIVLSVWSLLHVYAFQRAFSIPALARAVPLAVRVSLFALLCLSYPLGRVLARSAPGALARGVELVGAVWMGFLFLAFATFLLADVVTGFGKLWPKGAVPARSVALAVAGVLSVVAIVQAARGPRVVRHEVKVPSLPGGRTELKLVQLSDLHLGTLLGERWLGRRVAEVNALAPDLVVVTGDLVDSEVGPVGPLAPVLRGLRGAAGRLGRHREPRVLRRARAVPRGLRGGGDPDAARRVGRGGARARPDRRRRPDGTAAARPRRPHPRPRVRRRAEGRRRRPPLALAAPRPRGGLSRSPADALGAHARRAALAVHVYLSAIPYPFQAGRYEVDGMTLVVSRGTGTWGPPMRLFFRSEIVEVILRT